MLRMRAQKSLRRYMALSHIESRKTTSLSPSLYLSALVTLKRNFDLRKVIHFREGCLGQWRLVNKVLTIDFSLQCGPCDSDNAPISKESKNSLNWQLDSTTRRESSFNHNTGVVIPIATGYHWSSTRDLYSTECLEPVRRICTAQRRML